MSFRINHSHKFVSQHQTAPAPKEKSSLLSEEDYDLFNISKESTGPSRVQTKKGGTYISPVKSASSDYF
jgi:hypothetical protein